MKPPVIIPPGHYDVVFVSKRKVRNKPFYRMKFRVVDTDTYITQLVRIDDKGKWGFL